MATEVAEPSSPAIRMGSGALRIPRATRTRSSGDLDLKRYHSQELMQNEKEGAKVLMQGGAQAVSQPYAELNNGSRIPLVGLGTFKSTDEVMDEAVGAALRYGVRHIDCAEHYGNEPPIGRALSKAFKAGFAKREDIFITSKLWNTDHAAKDVKPALLKSLRDLQLDYLDLYLIHWPVTEPQKDGDEINPPLSETWAAVEKLVDEGLVKNIGVSNCSIKCIKKLLETARIKPQVNQVEIHPFWRNDELREYCASEKIHVSAYCPLGTPYTSAKAVIRRAQSVSSHPLVRQIAQKYQKHVLSLLLRWGIQRGNSVLAKSSNPHHIRGNLEGCLGWRISKEDMKALSTIEFQLRLVDGIRFLRPEGPFRTMDDMWNDTLTDECREKFINRMYKFPDNPAFALNTGARMPVLGLGTWKNQQVSNTVQRAIRRGFRHVDCSSQPDNEEEIGSALEEILSDWIVNRPDVFVTAKVQESEAGKIPEAVEGILQRLRTKYVDLLLLPTEHLKDSNDLEAAWRAMEATVEKGQAKAIGLVSASMRQISTILGSCNIKPAVNSIETHPACTNDRISHYCMSKGLHVMASSWPATAYMLHKKDAPAVLSNPTVLDIARKLGKHPSQALIRWAIQHGHSVSPKACSDVHLQGILDVLNWEMPEDDYVQMCQLDQEAPKKHLDDLEASIGEGGASVLETLAPPPKEEATSQ